jgi:hypothetical protein
MSRPIPPGTYPAGLEPRGMESWSAVQSQQWRSDGTNRVWFWETCVFDLRTGLALATGQQQAATPINHEAAIGLNFYLNVMISSRSGLIPPSRVPEMRVEYWERGHPTSSQFVQDVSRVIDITDTMLAGSDTVAAAPLPSGASNLSFTPCQPMLRFWQLCLRFTLPGTTPLPTANDLILHAMMH